MELERVRQSTAKVGPELHLHFFLVGLDIDLLLKDIGRSRQTVST